MRHRANLKALDRQLATAADPGVCVGLRKRASRKAAALAEKLGIIARPERCEWCHQRRMLERHHWDHAEPLNIAFMCHSCHEIANQIALSEAAS